MNIELEKDKWNSLCRHIDAELHFEANTSNDSLILARIYNHAENWHIDCNLYNPDSQLIYGYYDMSCDVTISDSRGPTWTNFTHMEHYFEDPLNPSPEEAALWEIEKGFVYPVFKAISTGVVDEIT